MSLFCKEKKPSTSKPDTRTVTAIPSIHGDSDLATAITEDYSLNRDLHLQECFQQAEEQIEPLLQPTDIYTFGSVFDPYVYAQVDRERNRLQEETAAHKLQAIRIINERNARKAEIDRLTDTLEDKIEALTQKIIPLEGQHAQFTLRLGKLRLPLGALVTLLAMALDALLNYSFLQNILLQSQFLLIIMVVCMSVMSDATMLVAGMLLSRKNQSKLSKGLYRLFLGALVALFLVSIIGSILIRFGSMPETYGSISASGEFVGKESYTLAEWGVTLISSFLTTATGLCSMVFSVDEGGYLEKQRLALEAERDALTAQYNELLCEKDALEYAVDPAICDEENRAAAKNNLENLSVGLKLHLRKLLALHQQAPEYTEAMSKSAQELLNNIIPVNKSQPSESEESTSLVEHDRMEVS